ncbi:hypothetical protein ACSNOK_31250, partial [Streptomyces sp. URMC 126]
MSDEPTPPSLVTRATGGGHVTRAALAGTALALTGLLTGTIAAPPAARAAAKHGRELHTQPGFFLFQPPAGVTHVTVSVWGGGGAGGSGAGGSGAGGGGGGAKAGPSSGGGGGGAGAGGAGGGGG